MSDLWSLQKWRWGAQSTHLLSGDSASSILRTHPATPPPSQRVSSLLDLSTRVACSLLELPLKKPPNTQQTKDHQEPTASYGGSPVPVAPLQLVSGPTPSQAWLQSCGHSPTPTTTLPSQQIRVRSLHWGHLRPGPTYCAEAGHSRAGVASPSLTPRTTAPERPGPGLPASAAGPPPASGPAVCPSTWERSPFPQKPPGAGRRTRL